jgi:hypothetical protein
MNSGGVILAGLIAGGAALAAEAPAWRVVPVEPAAKRVELPLPPLAEVKASDRSGETWQQSGQMSGSVADVHKEFAMALGAAGWALNKTISLGRTSARSELMIWTRKKQRVLLMVWEKEAGTCGFAWGEEK